MKGACGSYAAAPFTSVEILPTQLLPSLMPWRQAELKVQFSLTLIIASILWHSNCLSAPYLSSILWLSNCLLAPFRSPSPGLHAYFLYRSIVVVSFYVLFYASQDWLRWDSRHDSNAEVEPTLSMRTRLRQLLKGGCSTFIRSMNTVCVMTSI